MKHGVTQWLSGLIFVAYAAGCLALTLFLAHHQPQPLEPAPEVPGISRPETVKTLPNFAQIEQVPERKRAFFGMLMPMVEWRNHQLRQMRADVQGMTKTLANEGELTGEQASKLEKLRIHFRVSEDNYPEAPQALEELKRRVDIIPDEMVLAQAAAESGWGTSRFARQANNLFGQWCYRKGCGLVPSARSAGASHEVQKFDSVNEALSTYFRNINTNRAYREVRQIREQQRANGQTPTGLAMVEGLHRYSSRGQAYIEELKELIHYNNLERVKEVWLAPEENEETEVEEAP